MPALVVMVSPSMTERNVAVDTLNPDSEGESVDEPPEESGAGVDSIVAFGLGLAVVRLDPSIGTSHAVRESVRPMLSASAVAGNAADAILDRTCTLLATLAKCLHDRGQESWREITHHLLNILLVRLARVHLLAQSDPRFAGCSGQG